MGPAETSSREQNPEINHQSKKTSSSSHHLETQLVQGKQVSRLETPSAAQFDVTFNQGVNMTD